jgi:hypothetical protein
MTRRVHIAAVLAIAAASLLLLAPIPAREISPKPQNAAPQIGEPVENIVIGFVGGYVKPNNTVHAEVQLAANLRKLYPKDVDVETFGDHRIEQAHEKILALLSGGGDGAAPTAQQRKDARIILYGHSWGGAAAVELARWLQKDRIPVLLTVQVDSIPKYRENDTVIPANVAKAANFYQPHGVLHGAPEIRAADPAKTEILGNFKYDYSKSSLKCSRYPWWDRYLVKAHTQIECDPVVWNKIEGMIRAELPAAESAGSQ